MALEKTRSRTYIVGRRMFVDVQSKGCQKFEGAMVEMPVIWEAEVSKEDEWRVVIWN